MNDPLQATEIIATSDLIKSSESTKRRRRRPLWLKLMLWVVLPLSVVVTLVVLLSPTPEERMQSYYKKGMDFLAEENFDKANIEFRNALQIKKNMTEAVYGMALVAEKKGDLRKAFQHYQIVAEQDNKHVMARVKLANIFLMAGQPEKFDDYMAQLNQLAPEDAHVVLLKATAALRQGAYEEAVALAQKALAKKPMFNEAYALLAAERFENKDPEQALAILNQGLQKMPGDVSLSMLKVSLLENKQQLDEAAQVLLSLIKQAPKKNNLRIELVRFYIKHQKMAQAEEQLRALIAMDGKDHDAKLALLEVIKKSKGAEAASKQLQAFVQDDPKDMSLRFAQFNEAMRDKKQDAAKKILQAVIDDASEKQDRLKAKGYLAELYLADKNRKGAEALIAEVLKEDARDQQSLLLKANFDIEAGLLDAAIAKLLIVTTDQPNGVYALHLLAQTYAKNDQFAQANQYYQKAVEASQSDVDILMSYASFQRAVGELERAENLLNTLLEKKSDHLPALRMMAEIKSDRGDWKGAIAAVDDVRKVSKSPLVADYLLSSVYFKQKNYAASVPLIKKVYEAQPKDAQVLGNLISHLVLAGRSSEAVSLLNQIRSENPQDALSQLMLAQVYLQTKQLDKAVGVYQTIIQENSKVAPAYQSLAKLHLMTGKMAQAETVIEAGLKAHPSDLPLQFLKADLYQSTGKLSQAEAIYEAMLKEDPNSIAVLNNLAVLLVEHHTDKESLKRAYEMTQKFVRRETPELRDTVGWVAYKAGKPIEAVKALEFCVAKAPTNPVFQYHLGKAYIAVVDKVHAKQALQKALEHAGNRSDVPVEEIKQILRELA